MQTSPSGPNAILRAVAFCWQGGGRGFTTLRVGITAAGLARDAVQRKRLSQRGRGDGGRWCFGVPSYRFPQPDLQATGP